jgi:hypothetical protein
MVNKYPGKCSACGYDVNAKAGTLERVGRHWVIRHTACAGDPLVVEVRFGEKRFTRNSRGRCEDAPCCGCCTI